MNIYYYYYYYYCVPILGSVIQHVKRTRHIIWSLPSVACPAVPYFSHIIKGTIFGKKKLLNINGVF
jgi:hypothetical protein